MTIVPSYNRALALLLMLRTRNNTDSNKLRFSSMVLYYDDSYYGVASYCIILSSYHCTISKELIIIHVDTSGCMHKTLMALFSAVNISIVPRGPPLNVRGIVVNSSTVVLNWNPPDIGDQNGIVRYYVVNVIELQTANIFQFIANTTSLYITSLHPSYMYELTVSAATIGTGPFSPALMFQTPEAGRN